MRMILVHSRTIKMQVVHQELLNLLPKLRLSLPQLLNPLLVQPLHL
jgi:hypothetical protein